MIVLIMAGGLGKRMESSIPKVLHLVSTISKPEIKYPMLVHVILSAIKLNPEKIFIIVGKYKNIIETTINEYLSEHITDFNTLIEYINQEVALGTGDAIKCALSSINSYIDSNALILSGDVPLISNNTLAQLFDGNINKLLITKLNNPYGCGRIILNSENILGIVEEKDCTDEQRLIKYVNCGIYQFAVRDLIDLIPLIENNNKANEYYLTDIIGLMIKNNVPVSFYELEEKNHYEIKNVNTKKDLEELNEFISNM